jgi:hypothetical protein
MLEYWNDGMLGQMEPKTIFCICMVFPIIPLFRPSLLATDSYLLASKTWRSASIVLFEVQCICHKARHFIEEKLYYVR